MSSHHESLISLKSFDQLKTMTGEDVINKEQEAIDTGTAWTNPFFIASGLCTGVGILLAHIREGIFVTSTIKHWNQTSIQLLMCFTDQGHSLHGILGKYHISTTRR